MEVENDRQEWERFIECGGGGGGEYSKEEVTRSVDNEIGRGNRVSRIVIGRDFGVDEIEKPAIDGEI